MIGTFVANALSVGDTNGIDWIKLAIQVGLAAVGVSIYAGRSAPGHRENRRATPTAN